MEKESKTILWWLIGSVILCVTFSIFGSIKHEETIEIKSEVAKEGRVSEPSPSGSPSSTQTEEPKVEETRPVASSKEVGHPDSEAIEKEIKEVFGEHFDKAMLLLKGDGKEGACAENRSLNPNSLNDNTWWGGTGKDYGVFQINDYWQGIRHEGKAEQFLFDPHINIRIAWRIYEDSGYSFHLWTCGKVYGI